MFCFWFKLINSLFYYSRDFYLTEVWVAKPNNNASGTQNRSPQVVVRPFCKEPMTWDFMFSNGVSIPRNHGSGFRQPTVLVFQSVIANKISNNIPTTIGLINSRWIHWPKISYTTPAKVLYQQFTTLVSEGTCCCSRATWACWRLRSENLPATWAILFNLIHLPNPKVVYKNIT